MYYKDLKIFEEYCRKTGAPFTWAELKKWLEMNYKDLKRFEEYCRKTGTPFTWAELKKWLGR